MSKFQLLMTGEGQIRLHCEQCQRLYMYSDSLAFSAVALMQSEDVLRIMQWFFNHEHGKAEMTPVENYERLLQEVMDHCKMNGNMVWNTYLQEQMLRSAGSKP